MAIEIERRFRVVGESWKQESVRRVEITQGYLYPGSASEPSLRVRLTQESAWLTLKAGAGLTRLEFEYEIDRAEAQTILRELCGSRLIKKVRHEVVYEGHEWVVDIFEGANQGLRLAEIELATESESFKTPPWVGAEETGNSRVINAALALRPFVTWSQDEQSAFLASDSEQSARN